MTKTDSKLIMHKLMGTHEYVERFNTDIYDRENVCVICGHIEGQEVVNIEMKAKDIKNVYTLLKMGAITMNEAVELLGIDKEQTS